MQNNNPGQLTDDEDGDDEEEDDGVAPLSEVGVALYGGVDPHVQKCQQGKGSQTQQYQSESVRMLIQPWSYSHFVVPDLVRF